MFTDNQSMTREITTVPEGEVRLHLPVGRLSVESVERVQTFLVDIVVRLRKDAGLPDPRYVIKGVSTNLSAEAKEILAKGFNPAAAPLTAEEIGEIACEDYIDRGCTCPACVLRRDVVGYKKEGTLAAHREEVVRRLREVAELRPDAGSLSKVIGELMKRYGPKGDGPGKLFRNSGTVRNVEPEDLTPELSEILSRLKEDLGPNANIDVVAIKVPKGQSPREVLQASAKRLAAEDAAVAAAERKARNRNAEKPFDKSTSAPEGEACPEEHPQFSPGATYADLTDDDNTKSGPNAA